MVGSARLDSRMREAPAASQSDIHELQDIGLIASGAPPGLGVVLDEECIGPAVAPPHRTQRLGDHAGCAGLGAAECERPYDRLWSGAEVHEREGVGGGSVADEGACQIGLPAPDGGGDEVGASNVVMH